MQRGIAQAHAAYVIGHFDRVSFAIFRGAVTVEAIQALDQNHMTLVPRYGTVCTLIVAEGGLELPAQDARTESARLMRLRANTQLCSCTVIEGGGFMGAAARGVLTAIHQLSMQAYPLHTTRTLVEASAWTAIKAKRDADWATHLAAFINASRGKHTRLADG